MTDALSESLAGECPTCHSKIPAFDAECGSCGHSIDWSDQEVGL